MRAQSELLVVLVAPPSIELNQTSYLGGARAARLSIQHDGVNTAVARLTAELADVQYGLDQTVVRAQTEGFVTQVALRRCVPPWFSLITNKADQNLGAAFQQNSLQRVKAGDEAEVAFDAVPGRVFKGSPSPQIRFSQAER
jgi:multidrug resistance efflux pump